jgi:hypothetical protein
MVEKLIEVKSLLGLPEELEVVDGEITEKMITVVAVSGQTAPCCPLCGTSASRIHSHYTLLIGVFIREEGRKRLQLLLKGSEEDFSFEKEPLHIAVVIHATQFGAISILIIGRVSEVGNSKERTERWENAC